MLHLNFFRSSSRQWHGGPIFMGPGCTMQANYTCRPLNCTMLTRDTLVNVSCSDKAQAACILLETTENPAGVFQNRYQYIHCEMWRNDMHFDVNVQSHALEFPLSYPLFLIPCYTRQTRGSDSIYASTDETPSWWRHQMGTFSASLALCVCVYEGGGGFTGHRWIPLTKASGAEF